MPSLDSLLLVVHLLGMALGVGAAVVKTVLVLRARADLAFVPVLVAARRPVTKTLVAGLALATLSGIVWLVRGYPWTPLLIGKLAVVAAIWVLGPLIGQRLRTAHGFRCAGGRRSAERRLPRRAADARHRRARRHGADDRRAGARLTALKGEW